MGKEYSGGIAKRYQPTPGGMVQSTRRLVEREEMCTWRTRHVHKKEKKKKGPVEPEKEEEEDKLESFFYKIYDFHNPAPVFHNPVPVFVPVELPPRYVINFVLAVSAPAPVITSPVIVSSASVIAPASPVIVSPTPVIVSPSDYSVVSSVNFIPPCIEPKP